MKNMIELSKTEAIQIQGGGFYEVGKAVGSYCANFCDFWEGAWDSLTK